MNELGGDDDPASTLRRERVAILDRASAAIRLRPTKREQLVRLAQLAMQVRDDAVELRRHHRSIQQAMVKMMD